ncbi:hypothetical protein GCM10027188_29550 [Lysobacter humi (ex Lee et al. 2017)]
MGRAVAVVALVVAGTTNNAAACSLVTPIAVPFQASERTVPAKPPVMPPVAVQRIKRGNGADPNDSCSDLGAVTFAIPASRTARRLLYSFQTLRATGEPLAIDAPPSRGIEYQGQLLFTFPWLDGTHSDQEPFEAVVRITPYRPTGEQGEPVELVVSDNGR